MDFGGDPYNHDGADILSGALATEGLAWRGCRCLIKAMLTMATHSPNNYFINNLYCLTLGCNDFADL